MCSFGYFGKTKEVKNINLISPKNSQSFFIKKYVIRERLDFQLKHGSGRDLVTDDNKVHELLFTRLNKKKKI